MKGLCIVCAGLCLSLVPAAHTQMSLQTAVDLALRNSPKIRMARADVDKARAGLAETRDTYIPVVTTEGGYGQSTGAPLGVPVIFSLSAQSLVFSFSQADYIRAARMSLEAAQHSLNEQMIQVTEDTVNTYIALDNAKARQQVLSDERDVAHRLVIVTGERIDAGVDAKVEMPRARRTATQIELLSLQLEDEVLTNRRHLAGLTGLPETAVETLSESIPKLAAPLKAAPVTESGDGEGVAAADAAARAKQYMAFGDHRYLLRPQIVLQANYSRVDAGLSSYASYYPRFAGTIDNPNSSNSLGFGLQITVPLLDMAHRAKARGSAAEAVRVRAEADANRSLFREGRAKLRNSVTELQLRTELAQEEQEIAQDQLEVVELQVLNGAAAPDGPRLTPKDVLNARLQERQRALDLLNAQLQLREVQVNLLRQSESLAGWVLGTTGTAGMAPVPGNGIVVTPAANTPAVPGAPPSGASQVPPVVPAPGLPRP